ncbi:MAG TPA: hypothetical protein PLU50_04215, partial [Pseudobdellovibrionaceae bacterium]|nr:hypothetical protein [Pseudobdellovibrionaceae bacterium]
MKQIVNKQILMSALLSAAVLTVAACQGRKSSVEGKKDAAPTELKGVFDCSTLPDAEDKTKKADAAQGPKTKKECLELNDAQTKALWETLDKDEDKFIAGLEKFLTNKGFNINALNDKNKSLFEVASDKNKAKALT